jgi:hypothetical protein
VPVATEIGKTTSLEVQEMSVGSAKVPKAILEPTA